MTAGGHTLEQSTGNNGARLIGLPGRIHTLRFHHGIKPREQGLGGVERTTLGLTNDHPRQVLPHAVEELAIDGA
ncbi:hypothetical protein D9M69_684480 [compost metagenome]